MDANSIMLGKYSLPFILSIVLGLLYKRTNIPSDLKPYISMAFGCILGVTAMFYNELYASINFPMIADYVLAGGIAGSAATGIYEMAKQSPAGVSYIAIGPDNKKISNARVAKVSGIKVMQNKLSIR
jgi:hypothetical protein